MRSRFFESNLSRLYLTLVLVVDNSGSMNTHNICLHRDRQTAAYSTVALEFITEQIFNDTANNSDVFSLIGDAIKSLTTTLTDTRSSIYAHKNNRLTKRCLERKASLVMKQWWYYEILSHLTFDPRSKKWVAYDGPPPGSIHVEWPQEFYSRRQKPPRFLAIHAELVGQNAERFAFKARMADRAEDEESFVLGAVVA
jgi:hypothetical protein